MQPPNYRMPRYDKICNQCGQAYPGTKIQRYCSACQVARQKKRQSYEARMNRLSRKLERARRTVQCIECGARVKSSAANRKYCEGCRKEKLREYQRVYQSQRRATTGSRSVDGRLGPQWSYSVPKRKLTGKLIQPRKMTRLRGEKFVEAANRWIAYQLEHRT